MGLGHLGLPGASSTAPALGGAGCDEVAGQLGNPLSEAPEFWRAAPEAAVDWSAEELDLPPPPRLGEAEEDLVSTGLLRASGLRL